MPIGHLHITNGRIRRRRSLGARATEEEGEVKANDNKKSN